MSTGTSKDFQYLTWSVVTRRDGPDTDTRSLALSCTVKVRPVVRPSEKISTSRSTP